MHADTQAQMPRIRAMSEFTVRRLLQTDTLTVRTVCCRGSCRSRGAEECTSATHLVFPYRGLYLRHVGSDQAVADANHVLLFNEDEGYKISHPMAGGDMSLDLALSAAALQELVPAALLNASGPVGFRMQHQRIDARAQALVALLRHGLQRTGIETLEAESLALTLVCRSVGTRTSHVPTASHGRRRLVDRVKVLLASDLARRWTLAEIASEIGSSAVYLTQLFQRVEGVPLYRYQLRLRLARALDLLAEYEDLSALALHLGFSSHSHFTAAFRQAYGRSPSAFKQVTG
jgi:AraC family transcriptional regulator